MTDARPALTADAFRALTARLKGGAARSCAPAPVTAPSAPAAPAEPVQTSTPQVAASAPQPDPVAAPAAPVIAQEPVGEHESDAVANDTSTDNDSLESLLAAHGGDATHTAARPAPAEPPSPADGADEPDTPGAPQPAATDAPSSTGTPAMADSPRPSPPAAQEQAGPQAEFASSDDTVEADERPVEADVSAVLKEKLAALVADVAGERLDEPDTGNNCAPAEAEPESRPSEVAIARPADNQAAVETAVAAPSPPPPSSEPDHGRPTSLAPPPETVDIDPKAGETARMLLDMMASVSGGAQPQERALAADTLLRLVDRMPEGELCALAERLALMEQPPQMLVTRLINHADDQVAQHLIENGRAISDRDLENLARNCDFARMRMIARRRCVSARLSDVLIAAGDASVRLTVVRNPGVDISHDGFVRLVAAAADQPALQAPLATRADLPSQVAFTLFWLLPKELRRYVISRFLTDSEAVEKILAVTMAMEKGSRRGDRFASAAEIEKLTALVETGSSAAAAHLAAIAGIGEETARRIIADAGGEPLSVAMKALGASRAVFTEAVRRWIASPDSKLGDGLSADEMQALFDSLSFNKSRVLLTYWDWAAREAGPYARAA